MNIVDNDEQSELTNKRIIEYFIEYFIFTRMDIKWSVVLYFEFMRIIILLFRQFKFVVANDCGQEDGIVTWEKDSKSRCRDATHGYETYSLVCKGKDFD